MNPTALLTLAALALLTAKQPDLTVEEWFQERAVAVPGIDSQGATDEWVVLDAAVGEAPLVLLGEELHGVREFSQLKTRWIQHLVERRGFTVLAFEQDTIRCEAIDRYLQGGEGNPAQLLAGCYWCWNTAEVLDLLHWLREYNSRSERPVRFVGIDNQGASSAIERLLGDEGLTVEPPELLSLATAPLRLGRAGYGALPEGAKADHAVAVSDLRAQLSQAHADHEDAARILDEVRELWSAGNARERMNARDRHMAERTAELVQGNERVLVWAHNAHVSRALFYGGVVPLGKHLSDRFETCVVGFYFGVGEILLDPRAREEHDTLLITALPEAPLASVLSPVRPGSWMADLRGGEMPGPVRDFLTSPPAGHFENYSEPPSLVGAIDLLVYLDEVTPPEPVGTR